MLLSGGPSYGLKTLKYTARALRAVGFCEVLIKVVCMRTVSRYTHQLFLAAQLHFARYLTFYKHVDCTANGITTHSVAYRHFLGFLYF
jgi:hypothetical protein